MTAAASAPALTTKLYVPGRPLKVSVSFFEPATVPRRPGSDHRPNPTPWPGYVAVPFHVSALLATPPFAPSDQTSSRDPVEPLREASDMRVTNPLNFGRGRHLDTTGSACPRLPGHSLAEVGLQPLRVLGPEA